MHDLDLGDSISAALALACFATAIFTTILGQLHYTVLALLAAIFWQLCVGAKR